MIGPACICGFLELGILAALGAAWRWIRRRCPRCRGSGVYHYEDGDAVCPWCRGAGRRDPGRTGRGA